MTDTTTTNDLLTAFLLAHTDGPGLLDCIDNNGNRYTSQFLLNAIEKARAAVAAPPTPVSHVSGLLETAKGLKRLVEEIDGTMNHGTWRDDRGMRLKDTPEWVAFYNAISREAPDAQ